MSHLSIPCLLNEVVEPQFIDIIHKYLMMKPVSIITLCMFFLTNTAFAGKDTVGLPWKSVYTSIFGMIIHTYIKEESSQ